MRPFRFSVVSLVGSLLLTATAYGQNPWQEHWTTHTLSAGEHRATVRLPDGWSLEGNGISFSDAARSDCHIVFLTAQGDFEQRLVRALDDDRQNASGEMHSVLSHAGGTGGVRLVSVRYGDRAGRLIEKKYFALPSEGGDTLIEWALNAPRTHDGQDCATRFAIMADTFRISSQTPVGAARLVQP